MGFQESGLFLIGRCTQIKEVVGPGGATYGLYFLSVQQDGQPWDAKADFSLTELGTPERTRLGLLYEAGELHKFVGRRVAIRVIGVPSKTPPKEGHPGYVNYKAVSVVALDAEPVEEGRAVLGVVRGQDGAVADAAA